MEIELELTMLEEQIVSIWCQYLTGMKCPFPESCDYCFNKPFVLDDQKCRLLNFRETVKALTERGQRVSVIPNRKKYHR